MHQHIPTAFTTGRKILALLGDFVTLYLGKVSSELEALSLQICASQTEITLDDITKLLFLIQAWASIHDWLDCVATELDNHAVGDAEQKISNLCEQLIDRDRQMKEKNATIADLTDQLAAQDNKVYQLTSELDDSFAKIDALREALEEALAADKAACAQADVVVAQMDALRQQKAVAVEELARVQAEAAALAAENAALREREQAQVLELEAKYKEIAALRQQLGILQKQDNEHLQTEVRT